MNSLLEVCDITLHIYIHVKCTKHIKQHKSALNTWNSLGDYRLNGKAHDNFAIDWQFRQQINSSNVHNLLKTQYFANSNSLENNSAYIMVTVVSKLHTTVKAAL